MAKREKRLSCEERLKSLSLEFAVATGIVLMTDYEFTQQQAQEFLEKVTAQAKKNRDHTTLQQTTEAVIALAESRS